MWRADLRWLREHVANMPVAALLMGCQGRLSVSYPPGGAWRRVDLVTPWGLDCVRPLRLGRLSWKRNSEISTLSQSACGMSLRCRNPHAAFETDEPRAAGGREPGQSGQSGRSHATTGGPPAPSPQPPAPQPVMCKPKSSILGTIISHFQYSDCSLSSISEDAIIATYRDNR